MQAILDLLTELWNSGNLKLLPQVYSADAERIDPNYPQAIRGAQQIADAIVEVHTGFPDFKIEVTQRIGEEDQVATQWTCTGTHTGVFQSIPATGRRVTIAGVTVGRIQDSKIVEERAYFDRLDLLQQLGVAPGSAQGEATLAAHR